MDETAAPPKDRKLPPSRLGDATPEKLDRMERASDPDKKQGRPLGSKNSGIHQAQRFSKTTVIKTKNGGSPPKPRNVPEVIAPILLKSKITRKALANYTQQLMVAFAPHILPEAMKSLLEKVVAGDKDGLNQAFEIYGLKSSKQGGPLVQILNQLNAGGAEPERQESGYKRSMEFVLREQEKRKQIEAGNVIDVTPEPVPS